MMYRAIVAGEPANLGLELVGMSRVASKDQERPIRSFGNLHCSHRGPCADQSPDDGAITPVADEVPESGRC